ncbi:MAG: CRISPR-associated endonuclease Cas1, partial [Chloroflexi bacterium]|nr:CRISPR-associated endonuclease Cas1 [Chloroflexota bacterium]
MPPLYVTTQGAKLRYEGRRLIVEKDDQEITSVPAVHVGQVLILGNAVITTPALTYLLDKSIDTVFLSIHGRYKGRLVGPLGGQGKLRLLQYQRVLDPAYALQTASAIVCAKLHNTRTFLRRYARRTTLPSPSSQNWGEGEGPGERIGDGLTAAADQLTALIDQASRCRTVNSLSGVEGRGAAIYFGVFRHLIQDTCWTFAGRTRRPPRDPVNALLSFGYTILTHNLESAVRTVGLDPHLGFLHQVAYNRPSLALDLVEEFRTLVIDSITLRCLNNAILQPAHFTIDPQAEYPVLLTDEGRARFIRELETRLALEFQHP